MNRRRWILMAGLACLALVTPLAAAADITGKWTSDFDTPLGPMSYAFEFVVKEGKLTGTAKSSMFGESPLTEGKVEGDKVTFVEIMDGSIRVEYTGKIVSADVINFSRKVGEFGTEELVAKRVKPQQIEPGPAQTAHECPDGLNLTEVNLSERRRPRPTALGSANAM